MRSLSLITCSLIAALALALSGCGEEKSGLKTSGDSGSGFSGTLRLAGSSTLAPLAVEIGKRFEKAHPEVRVEVQTGGSSRGIADARKGSVEVGMSSRDMKESEKDGLKQWVVAMDGVCFLVHKSNPVKELTREQLVGIYMGKIKSWSEVGGHDAEIVCINRADGRSELELVTSFFGIKPVDIHADLVAGENQQGIKMVATDKNAITYMSVGASEYEANAGTEIALLPLDGIASSVANVTNGTYPLSRPLLYITVSEPTKMTQAFIDFSQSKDVHDLVEEFSYVPIQN